MKNESWTKQTESWRVQQEFAQSPNLTAFMNRLLFGGMSEPAPLGANIGSYLPLELHLGINKEETVHVGKVDLAFALLDRHDGAFVRVDNRMQTKDGKRFFSENAAALWELEFRDTIDDVVYSLVGLHKFFVETKLMEWNKHTVHPKLSRLIDQLIGAQVSEQEWNTRHDHEFLLFALWAYIKRALPSCFSTMIWLVTELGGDNTHTSLMTRIHALDDDCSTSHAIEYANTNMIYTSLEPEPTLHGWLQRQELKYAPKHDSLTTKTLINLTLDEVVCTLICMSSSSQPDAPIVAFRRIILDNHLDGATLRYLFQKEPDAIPFLVKVGLPLGLVVRLKYRCTGRSLYL